MKSTMLSYVLEVPAVADLSGLPVSIERAHEPGVVAVTAEANDGDLVTLTWDEIAESVHIRWRHQNIDRLTIAREMATKVSIRAQMDDVEFRVWMRSEGLGGLLLVRIAELVTVSDTVLRA